MRYLHFTTPARARRIVESGVLLPGTLNRLGVWAVPEGGFYLPWLQRWDSSGELDGYGSHRQLATTSSKTAAVLFTTRELPDIAADPEQVGWSFPLQVPGARVLALSEARSLLDTRFEHLRPRGFFDDSSWPQTHDYPLWASVAEQCRRAIGVRVENGVPVPASAPSPPITFRFLTPEEADDLGFTFAPEPEEEYDPEPAWDFDTDLVNPTA